jgi:hypothetical protein
VAFLPVVVFGWQDRPKMFLPYAVIIVAMAGIMASKYFGKVVNAVFAIAVSCIGTVSLAFYESGKLVIGLGPIFVSATSVIAPVVFILVAIATYRLRRLASP